MRAGKISPLKRNADLALVDCPLVHTVFVVQHTNETVAWTPERDRWYHQDVARMSAVCEPELMDAEDPLFILYTSGSTQGDCATCPLL